MKLLCVTVAACALAAAPPHLDTTSERAPFAATVGAGLGESCGIFVSKAGEDTAGCGLDPQSPCLTIDYGISRAQFEGLSCVFIQAGVYNEVVQLVSGIHLVGGYNLRWQLDSYTLPSHAVRIVGGVDSISSRYMTIRAAELNEPTRISNLIVQGPNATGGTDRSCYTIYANNSDRLVLEQVQIEAGNGAHGVAGSNGVSPPVSAPNGQNGAPGLSVGSCNTITRGAGGLPGNNNCSGMTTSGGMGGQGGTANTSCPFGLSPTGGLPGFGGNGSNPGQGGTSGSPCGGGGSGSPGGAGLNGNGGFGGTSIGGVSGGFWSSTNGGNGQNGTNGSGGGGGAGAGGCNTTHYGAGGGGGGAGGCAGSGGFGGSSGGSSFGIFAVNSIVQLEDVDIIRGIGGNGGSGGIGGRGQLGGIGGSGGPTGGGGSPGGSGGNGGNGGHGGSGGGGIGGHSFGIYCSGSQFSATNVTYSGGAPGGGGAGGAPAPGNHLPPGNPGQNGAGGVLGNVSGCSSTSSLIVDACDASPCLGGGGEPCVGDLNNDGVVNVADLLLLLSNWGNCD